VRIRAALVAVLGGLALGLTGCPDKKSTKDDVSPTPNGSKLKGGAAADAGDVSVPPTRYDAGSRMIAIGDVHGDLSAALRALRLAGAIDGDAKWSGGDLVVVQTGDLLDRGDDEPELLALFERLESEAAKAGGRFLWLNGNHEVMNVAGDFRYVSPNGIDDYGDKAGRRKAFVPGGDVAKILAGQPVVALVGDSLFAHGGILPRHVNHGLMGLQAINRVNTLWMLGRSSAGKAPAALDNIDSPIWTRYFSFGQLPEDRCQQLNKVLKLVGAKRLIVGHTVQDKGITSSCDGKVWRVDVGMSAYYGGPIQVLEIRGDSVKILGKQGGTRPASGAR